MSEAGRGLPELRRLVVALGGAVRDETALLLAARLARRLNVELSALFLEDAELVDVAALPVTAFLTSQTTERRRLDLVSVERGFRVEARRLRNLVASVSERQHLVRWTFEVRRVHTCEEIARQLGREELLMIAPQGRAERRRRLGEAMACRTGTDILILGPGRRHARGHIAILHQGDDAVLQPGACLTEALESALSIIPVQDAASGAAPDTARMRQWTERLPLPTAIAEAVTGDFECLRIALDRLDPDIVVIGRSGPAISKLPVDALDALIGPRAVLIPGGGAKTVGG